MANEENLKKVGGFQKGNPGGPGRPKNWLTQHHVSEVLGRWGKLTLEQADKKLEDKETPLLELALGRQFKIAAMGDGEALDRLLNRSIGKPKESVKIESGDATAAQRIFIAKAIFADPSLLDAAEKLALAVADQKLLADGGAVVEDEGGGE